MPDNPRVFMDISALFAGIWSEQGGARLILKLGEAGAVQIVLSQQVLTEIESTLRAKAPHSLGALALLLDHSRVQIVINREIHLPKAKLLVSHTGDAEILASAMGSGTDFFVTLDRKHFLDQPTLRQQISFPMGTPGDFLTWYRARLQSLST